MLNKSTWITDVREYKTLINDSINVLTAYVHSSCYGAQIP
jgi:hypothetical protein